MLPKMTAKKNSTSSDDQVTRVMIFGTFDIVHPGHRNFFKQARSLAKNPFLIVSIARDKNVRRIKGVYPSNTQWERRLVVAQEAGVDRVVLGGAKDHVPHIIFEKPDIIALGYDQVAYIEGLDKALQNAGLKTKIIRLKPYKPHLYKTSIIRLKTAKK